MKYPKLLEPTTTHLFQLASGPLKVPKVTPLFTFWSGPQPADTFGGKQVLDFAGRPAFAELVVLWSLQSLGWEGVWIDAFRKKYRVGYWDSPPVKELPGKPAELLKGIQRATGSLFRGAWDVLCWRGQEVLVAECKRAHHDAMNSNQILWLQAAMGEGLSADDFLVVEWSLTP
jgi:hypothetical protein